jgi:adenylate kinase
MTYSRIIILGKPGAGKSTQAKLLSEALNLPLINLGNTFLEEIKEKTIFGETLKKYMNSSKIIPDKYCNSLFEIYLTINPQFILDGSPRSLNQAKYINNLLTENPIDIVFNLNIPNQEAANRLLQRPREDTKNITQILGRLKEYDSKSQHCIDYYRQQNKLIQIDAMQDINLIHSQIYTLSK